LDSWCWFIVCHGISQKVRAVYRCVKAGVVVGIVGNERNGRRDERLRGQQPLEMLLKVVLRRH
jgi:hypothetical protein